MAARKNPKNPPQSYELQRAKQLLNRLSDFVNGKCSLTQAQVQAARVVIGKEIPEAPAENTTHIDGTLEVTWHPS